MAKGNWIQGATDPSKKGQLHKDLGIPPGQKIPTATLQAAAKRNDKTGQRARFALSVRNFKR